MKLITPRLVLSTLTSRDARRVLAFLRSNRRHLEWSEPTRPPDYYTLAGQRRILDDEARTTAHIRFWITLQNSSPIIGSVLLGGIDWNYPASCFLGYRIAEAHTGKGYMTEAAAAVIDYAFRELKLKRIEANIMPINTPSLRTAKKLGFTRFGFSRGYLQINGRREDHIRTELHSKEWISRPCPFSYKIVG